MLVFKYIIIFLVFCISFYIGTLISKRYIQLRLTELKDLYTSQIFCMDSQIYADIYAIKFITISTTYMGMTPYQNMSNMNNMNNMGMNNWNTNMNSNMSNMQNTNANMYRSY